MSCKKLQMDSLRTHWPRHVAIIMDGNGRWAEKKGKLRIIGHKEGARSVRSVVNFAVNHRLFSLTLYAFSSENWHRPEKEVTALMRIFMQTLENEVKNLHKNNVCFQIIGDISRFTPRLQNRIRSAEELTANNNGLKLNIAANYGGRWDITQSVRSLAELVKIGQLEPSQINEELINSYLSLKEQPDVDLMIRTGGEYRVSNFLLWQIAYTEFYFTDVLWPDFDKFIFESALNAFAKRERRFGMTVPIDVDIS
ncbi:polyprenyl diphosphate synthase [Candidatus Williamhamiltonella defendens]|uniref:polyprenyl diphosphate synthase n=1 Tax=Candidatus Williamhamiltonella defendens TaxID=138072 RepID=UPI00130EFB18|nr:polyprenyl diphosphate synthase [Candidatus Hamiltonella defensa]